MTDLREKLDNFRSWANIPGDPIREPRRSYIDRYHSALAKAWESSALVPAPAVPDDVAKIVAELRVIGCHENGDARCTCGIGMDAADALEAQDAELARLRIALEGLLHHEIGHVGPYAGQRVMEARAALTQPVGERT